MSDFSSDDENTDVTETTFDPISFLEASVAIASHEDVAPMRQRLVETLESRGVDTRLDDAGNVLATRGERRSDSDGATSSDDREAAAPHVVLNTHIDTVSPHVPLERDDEAGVICGRGACDAKGPLAALLAAFLAVDPGDGRLTLAVTPDEETYSTGAHALVTGSESPITDADAVIVGEPTGGDVCTAAKGRFEGTITLSGSNAHAAEPASGVNAIAALEDVLAVLRTFDDRVGTDDHPDLGGPTLTPTVVAGGEATNQVPADCRLTIDRRSVPPETAHRFQRALLEELESTLPNEVDLAFSFTERPTPFLEAWETKSSATVVRALLDAAEHQGGSDQQCAIRPFTAATEASYFAAHAPTVVYGPGVLADEEGGVAHAEREYVRIEDVRTAAATLERALIAIFD